MKVLTKCLKALANERRLHILQELAKHEPLPINRIAKRIGLSLKSTSKHIQKLVECDFIERRQSSLWIWCTLNRRHPVLQSLIKHFKR